MPSIDEMLRVGDAREVRIPTNITEEPDAVKLEASRREFESANVCYSSRTASRRVISDKGMWLFICVGPVGDP
jgi:hypothetical protein